MPPAAVAPRVALLLCYVTLSHLPTIMACAVVSIVAVAAFRDSEMAICFRGIVLRARAAGPATSLPCGVVSVLLLCVWRWAPQQLNARALSAGSDLSRVTPGVFQPAATSRVFFSSATAP